MATFITSKLTGETINIGVQTSTGYWKFNHNGTDYGPFTSINQSALVENPNGEFTIMSWDNDLGQEGGDITYVGLANDQLTSFDGTGLSGLTQLYLQQNQLTGFTGTGLSGLTELDLNNNQLTGFTGTGLSGLIQLNLVNNQLTSFDGTDLTSLTTLYLSNNLLTGFTETGLSSLTYFEFGFNPLTEFDGTTLTSLIDLYLNDNNLTSLDNFIFPSSLLNLDLSSNQLISFNGTGLSGLTYLGLSTNQLTSFTGAGLSGLTQLHLYNNLLTSFDGTDLTSLTTLFLSNNLLTGLDVSPMVSLITLVLNDKDGGNPLTTSANDSILNQLEANGLTGGEFYTTGGRTAAGTTDYDTLISRGWTIEGADLVSNPVWYRFKAPSTEAWDGTIGVDSNQNIKEVWLYQSAGFTYYDFLTTQSIGEVKFNVQGTEIEIVATQVQVTLQEFSSSGSFTAGIGLEGNAVGYANTTAFGSWGTLNSGTLPAIPSRYEGDVPAGSVIFSDATLQDGSICTITAPILLSLTVNGNEISLTGINGNPTGTQIPMIGFQENDEVTFSMTWGELVETTPPSTGRKLRVKGVGQLNP